MRYIGITIPYGQKLVLPVGESTIPLLAALSHGNLFTEEGYGEKKKVTRSESEVELEFVSEKYFTEATEPLKKLAEAAELASQRWLDEYNKRIAVEKELAELKGKAKSITQAAEALEI